MTVAAAVAALRAELDRCAESGVTLDLWWRDDDAVRASPELDRLLGIARDGRAPLAIAAVPGGLEPSLPERLAGEADVSVLVHGWRHADHAPPGEKSAEFGQHRPAEALARDARAGLDRIAGAFGPQALPVFVPPWNRIDPVFAATLPRLGFRGLSASGRPGPERDRDGFVRADVHLDPVAWREGGGLARPDALAAGMRRAASGGRLVGLLTHHLAFRPAHWDFTVAFLDMANRHPAVRIGALGGILNGTPARAGPFNEGRTEAGPARPTLAEAG